MMKSSAKALKWTSLMSSVAFVAISASAFASAPSTSAVPVVSANLQIADGQQPDKKLPPPQNTQQHTQQQKQPLQQQTQQQQPKQPLQQQTQQQQSKQPLQQQTQQQQPKQPQQQQARRYDWTTYQPGHRPPQWQQYSQNFDRQPYEVNRDSDRHYQSQP